jgi:demethylmenaquinone methyltransferase / 2-methoxy-6-polyprenyl-1,4-benzoquinol methylase
MDRETKAAHVKAVFTDIADHYDFMNSVLSLWQHKIWRRFAMKHVNLGKGGTALDVACGTGDWTLSLAKAAGDNGKVVGIDFTREMLNVAREKLRKRGLLDRTVELVEGDAMELPFAEDSFEVATIGFALRNVPDILTVLSEMTRVVKPGGRVVSLELSKPEAPIFKSLYYLYFNHILPHIGSLAARSKKSYAWLPESLVDFPDRRGIEQLFRQAGLSDVRSYPLTGGIAALHVGRKA